MPRSAVYLLMDEPSWNPQSWLLLKASSQYWSLALCAQYYILHIPTSNSVFSIELVMCSFIAYCPQDLESRILTL